MNRDDVIRIAKETGVINESGFSGVPHATELERFATIIAAEQQSWIESLEAHARDADRLYKELETELAASQAQIKVLISRIEELENGKHN